MCATDPSYVAAPYLTLLAQTHAGDVAVAKHVYAHRVAVHVLPHFLTIPGERGFFSTTKDKTQVRIACACAAGAPSRPLLQERKPSSIKNWQPAQVRTHTSSYITEEVRLHGRGSQRRSTQPFKERL